MKLIISILLCMSLSACFVSFGKLDIDERILSECKDLPEVASSKDKVLLTHTGEILKNYQECRKWNHEKNKVLKKLQGTN